MKRFVLLFSLFALALTSCIPTDSPLNEDGKVHWHVAKYRVESADWILVGQPGALKSYYKYEFSEPKLTKTVCEDGNVVGYRYTDDQDNQVLMPHVNFGGEVINGRDHVFTESYSYSFRPGVITFYVDYSDFETGQRPPMCDFRVVMTW